MTPQYAPFLGDQRRVIYPPTNAVYGTHALPVRAHIANTIIRRFVLTRTSHHSCAGSTMWVIISFCRHNRLGYTVTPARADDNSVLGWCVTLSSKPHIRLINGYWCFYDRRTSRKPVAISNSIRTLTANINQTKSRA